ncbi:ParA family protein [Streptomyces blattellae]|uniref:ParA family protein n=1 Tax=Streptomyces blattellae TaxID=2569855 RepID=UPI0012B89AC7|nr:AAA family ATPase [Streptomyces blattellae]
MTSDIGGRGRIVTFYSYKGGAGRTMALVNVGWILASAGRRVLVVDWDLEAPGAHNFLHPLLVDTHLRSTDGLIELVRGYVSEVLRPPAEDEPDDGDWLRAWVRPARYVTGTDLRLSSGGRLDLMPAGRQQPRYAAAVSTFNWYRFYEALGGGTLLQTLRGELTAAYDYVLVDCRAGAAPTVGMCTVALPDDLVACFPYSLQSIEGTAATAVTAQRSAPRPLRVLPVPMRVEDSERDLLERARDTAREVFAPCLSWLVDGDHDRYWGEVETPYRSFYAHEEIPATVGDRPAQPGTLLAAYERLTSWISDGTVTSLVPLPEEERRRLMRAYRDRDPYPDYPSR